MRIATWNVERLKHHTKADQMYKAIEAACADILVLTETDRRFLPAYPYEYHSPMLREIRPDYSDLRTKEQKDTNEITASEKGVC